MAKTGLIWLLPLLLAGCVTQTPGGGTIALGGRVEHHFTGAPGCVSTLAQFRTVIDNDVQTGNLNKSVYDRVVTDLEGPKARCASGREAEANAQLAAVKGKYGYR